MSTDEANRKYSKAASTVDFNGNGVDDYADIVTGARKDAENHPAYDSDYYQGGDIVVFQHVKHIGVISDKRDKNGTPYVIYNMAQKQRENDYFSFKKHMTVTGHYRFDASKVPQSVLKAWQ